MPILTTAQVIQQMRTFLATNAPQISTQTGTVVADAVIDAPAQQFGEVYTTLQQTQELQSLAFASTMTTEQLDAIAANYNLIRLLGTSATSIITFRIRNFNFSSSTINISAGTVVSTVSSTNVPAVSFTTSSLLVFLPSLAPSYFNPVSGFYEQSVTVISSSIGVTNNVPAGTITQLVTSVPGIDAIINSISSTGGTDVESNVAFAQRIVIKLSGNNVGTPNGILSLVEATPGVIQAIVVGPNDPEMQRDQFGGSVDVYVRGQILTSVSDTPMYTTTGSQIFILNHQPALTVGSITGIVSSAPYIFVPTVDYNFVENPNTLFAGSTEAASFIQWILSGTKPDNNSIFTISYTYDSLIETLQALFNNDSNHIAASDILVREAQEAFISVTNSIVVLPGFIPSNVVTNIQTALSTYINGLGLGAVIDLSDVVVVEELVAGVDAVLIDTLTVSSTIGATTTTIPPSQRLVIGKLAFTAPGTLAISVA